MGISPSEPHTLYLTAGKIYGQAVKRHWFAYLMGVLAMAVTSLTEVMVPKVIQWSLDVVTAGGGEDRVAQLASSVSWLLGSLIAGFVGRIAWRQILARRTHIAGWDLKVRMWDSLRYQPLRILHRYSLGDLMNRATGDWAASRTIFGFSVVLTFDLIFFALFAVIAMFTIDVSLTVYSLLIFPVLPYFIGRLARREHDLHAVAQESLGQLSDNVAQSLGAIRLLRATATGAVQRERLSEEARDYATKRFAVVKTGWKIFPLGALPTLFAYGVLMVLGLAKMRAGTLTLGQFVAMQSYVLMLQTPLFELGDCIAEWQKGWASLARIAEILSLKKPKMAEEEKNKPHLARKLPDLGREGDLLVVRHLTFAYSAVTSETTDTAERPPVIKDVSLTVGPSARIGIYGPIGSGKSTLLYLLAGLTESKPGQIYLGGVDVTEIPRSWYAAHVTVVPQRAFLFAGSIRKNLELSESLPEAAMWDVLNVVGLQETVRSMPHGLDTWIGEWGITLSGGQRQRLALARALLRPKPLLLLDDCLSAVDTVTEDRILQHLSQRLGDTAIVWVAHRPSTLKLCDHLYAMDAGVLSSVSDAELSMRAPGSPLEEVIKQ